MASLTLTIGPISGTISANNTKAANIVTQYAAAIGAEGTDTQKLNAVVLELARHMQNVGQRQRLNAAKVEAMATIQAEIDALKWE